MFHPHLREIDIGFASLAVGTGHKRVTLLHIAQGMYLALSPEEHILKNSGFLQQTQLLSILDGPSNFAKPEL